MTATSTTERVVNEKTTLLGYPLALPQTWTGLFAHRVRERGDEKFLRLDGVWRTWSELDAITERTAAGLQALGVSKGDRVAYISETCGPLIECYIAAARAGAVNIPVNVFLKGAFLRHQLENCKARTVVVDRAGYESLRPVQDALPDLREVVVIGWDKSDPDFPPGAIAYADIAGSAAAFDPPDIGPDDLFQVSYTSGTTGRSKGCRYPNRNILRHGAAVQYLMGLTDADVQYCHWPIYHNSGAVAIAAALVVGMPTVVEPKFEGEDFLRRANEAGATYFVGMGPVSRILLDQPPSDIDSNNSLRVSLMVPSSSEVQSALRERFGFESTSEMWGMSECVIATGNPIDGRRSRGTSGRALPDLDLVVLDGDREVEVGEVGEICFRPKEPGAIFDGYLDNPAATLASIRNLWFRSGDLARLEDDGNITFVDRARDMVRRSGENVSSFELEAAIRGFAPVVDAAVTETAAVHERDNDLVAWVTLASGEEMDIAAFAEYLWENVPYYAVPRFVAVVEQLPTTPSGRVMKYQLRDQEVPDSRYDLKALGLLTPRERRR